MDSRLARELEALGSDVALRRRNLQALFSRLTLPEIWELNRLVSGLDMRTDIFSRLPAELRLHVAEYVDEADIINFLNVSRTWREAWSQPMMMSLLMPEFVHYHRQQETITQPGHKVQDLFYIAARSLRARCRGEYRSALEEAVSERDSLAFEENFTVDLDYHQRNEHGTFSELDLVSSESPLYIQRLLYSDGRVAWQPLLDKSNNSIIIVDNLVNQVRKAYTIPEAVIRGGEAKLEALGSKLVVASLDRILHAWDLETNEHRSVTLPSRSFRCRTYNNQIYIYPAMFDEYGGVRTAQIHMWRFKGSFRDLDTIPLLRAIEVSAQQVGERTPCFCNGVIPHPLLDETIYVVCELGSVTTLHRYTQGVYSKSLSFTIPQGGTAFRPRRDFSERLLRVNAYGKYAVSVLDSRHSGLEDQQQLFRLLCFDTITESFSFEEYTVPGDYMDITADFTWWESYITTFGVFKHVRSLSMMRKTATNLENDLGERDTKAENAIYLPTPWTSIHRKNQRSHFRFIRPQSRLMFADEKYMVICGERGYVALSFWNDFTEKIPLTPTIPGQEL